MSTYKPDYYHKNGTDPYQLFKSIKSSNDLFVDHLRADIIKRMSRMYSKGQTYNDAIKSLHQIQLLVDYLEETTNGKG